MTENPILIETSFADAIAISPPHQSCQSRPESTGRRRCGRSPRLWTSRWR
jgi:hypothetical protein